LNRDGNPTPVPVVVVVILLINKELLLLLPLTASTGGEDNGPGNGKELLVVEDQMAAR